jgi:hypothetical protein
MDPNKIDGTEGLLAPTKPNMNSAITSKEVRHH